MSDESKPARYSRLHIGTALKPVKSGDVRIRIDRFNPAYIEITLKIGGREAGVSLGPFGTEQAKELVYQMLEADDKPASPRKDDQIYEEGCASGDLYWSRHAWPIPGGWKWHVELWTDPAMLDADVLGVTATREQADALSEAELCRLLKHAGQSD